MTIHWCGTGLSSAPGLRRLIENGHKVVVWNRTVEKAQEAVGDLSADIRAYSLEALAAALQPGDIAISMLPADQHVAIAKTCLEKGRAFRVVVLHRARDEGAGRGVPRGRAGVGERGRAGPRH